LKQRVLLIWVLGSLAGVPRASYGQQAAPAGPRAAVLTLTGTVRDALGQPLELVVVSVEGQPGGATTTATGSFTLRLTRPVGEETVVLVARRLGYQTIRQSLRLPTDASQPLRVVLQPDTKNLTDVTVRARAADADTREQASLIQLDPQTAKVLPSPFGDFNAILKTLPGVISNNELTSTYNVRGGNYDENLLYVNGFEVYRPFLVTQAQQEGLSFINPDLVQKVDFSTGGWQPKYGDKLSSVLDIQYKEPAKFAASATASLVGGAAHAEARSANGRVSYLGGVRYKNAQYVLNSLRQNQGQYNPTFYDARPGQAGRRLAKDQPRVVWGAGAQRLPLCAQQRAGDVFDRWRAVHARQHLLRWPRAHAVRHLPGRPEFAAYFPSRLAARTIGLGAAHARV
jgi:hypothetical protein